MTINCSGDGQIYADPDLFERAVGNLLDNALRFTAEHGSIRVALSKHNSDFEVTVSDNGCGIAAEHLPRVFDRFYRAESSRSSDGAGLGLALVKSIVELHGGSAMIQSELSRGTTVGLDFQRAPSGNAVLKRSNSAKPGYLAACAATQERAHSADCCISAVLSFSRSAHSLFVDQMFRQKFILPIITIL